jgi:hypothetical protein
MRISTADAAHAFRTHDPPHVIGFKRLARAHRVRRNTVLASVMPEELRMNGMLGMRHPAGLSAVRSQQPLV